VASKSLMEWLKMLWEVWRTSAWCDSSRFVLCALSSVCPFSPLRRGSSSSFYRPRRERITRVPRYLAT
jgi:hypothetical protein